MKHALLWLCNIQQNHIDKSIFSDIIHNMNEKRFRFANGQILQNGGSLRVNMPIFRDIKGQEYIAYTPPHFEALGYLDMGRKWRVTKIGLPRSNKRYVLKTLINEVNFKEFLTIIRVQGHMLHDIKGKFIASPKIIDAGFRSDGANYIIEEEMHGIEATPKIIESMSKREHDHFFGELGTFFVKLHSLEKAGQFSKQFPDERPLLHEPPPVDMPISELPHEDRHLIKLVQQYHSAAPSLTHGDMAPRHLLIDEHKGKLNIIDWGNAGLRYPYVEFERMHQDLWGTGFGSKIINEIVNQYCYIGEGIYQAKKELAKKRESIIAENALAISSPILKKIEWLAARFVEAGIDIANGKVNNNIRSELESELGSGQYRKICELVRQIGLDKILKQSKNSINVQGK